MAKVKSKPANKKVKKPTKTGKRGLKTQDSNSARGDGDTMNLEPPDIEWTEELTFQMLTEIIKDEDIKQGLFPVPGLNPRNQGVPKTHWHWTLCEKLSSEHKEYKSWFQMLQEKVMGATGTGIMKRSDVDKSHQNPFVTKWMEIEGHPNNVPVSLGKNDTAVDMTAILWSSPDFAADDDVRGYESKEWDIERQSPGLEMIERKSLTEKGLQRKKKQKKDKFAEIAQAEEVTQQKEMDVAKVKLDKTLPFSRHFPDESVTVTEPESKPEAPLVLATIPDPESVTEPPKKDWTDFLQHRAHLL
ncbi:hypothetical protein F4604DRAFT_1688315 [Suillus subluteus]|nr:hypothetical protein F4604DRAFT_1688315 [Suillus subluteus]